MLAREPLRLPDVDKPDQTGSAFFPGVSLVHGILWFSILNSPFSI